MKIYFKNFGQGKREVSITEAIEDSLDGSNYDFVSIVTIQNTIDNCCKMLGQIAQFLHENNSLTDKNITELLSPYYESEENERLE